MKTFEKILNEDGGLFYKSTGVSMLPLIREGRDLVYIKKHKEERLKKYDVVLFRRLEDNGCTTYVLHRILKVNKDKTYWIAGDNCTNGETVEEENILGVLTVVKRKGREVKVSDFWYKFYIYLWCAPYPIRFFILRCKAIVGRIYEHHRHN